MTAFSFVINGRLDGLNELISAERANKYKGAACKRKNQNIVISAIRSQMPNIYIPYPVRIHYIWFEKNERRDMDNISGAGKKFINDALVEAGVIKDDGWKCVKGFTDSFQVDKKNPRIEVILEVLD